MVSQYIVVTQLTCKCMLLARSKSYHFVDGVLSIPIMINALNSNYEEVANHGSNKKSPARYVGRRLRPENKKL
jgi:hypothetical protein